MRGSHLSVLAVHFHALRKMSSAKERRPNNMQKTTDVQAGKIQVHSLLVIRGTRPAGAFPLPPPPPCTTRTRFYSFQKISFRAKKVNSSNFPKKKQMTGKGVGETGETQMCKF